MMSLQKREGDYSGGGLNCHINQGLESDREYQQSPNIGAYTGFF